MERSLPAHRVALRMLLQGAVGGVFGSTVLVLAVAVNLALGVASAPARFVPVVFVAGTVSFGIWSGLLTFTEEVAKRFPERLRAAALLAVGVALPVVLAMALAWLGVLLRGGSYHDYLAKLTELADEAAAWPVTLVLVGVAPWLLPFLALGLARLDALPGWRVGAPWPARWMVPLVFLAGLVPMTVANRYLGQSGAGWLGGLLLGGLWPVATALGMNLGRSIETRISPWPSQPPP